MHIGLGHYNGIEGQAGTTESPRLVRAAQEFEAQMMKELLKPMTGQDALNGDEMKAGGDAGAGGALGEFATDALGQAISRHGGFGIANRIIQDISGSGPQSENGKVAVSSYEKSAKNG